jgi:branched-chain amino acid transport system ATP-binding protein
MQRPVLEACGLRKEFAGFVAVDGVDLHVREGSVHALIGPNGAGKTTTFNLLTRFLPPSSGTIFYRGSDITRTPAATVADMGLVRSFQISAVFPSLTLRDNLLVALQQRNRQSRIFWKRSQTDSATSARIDELLAEVGLLNDAEQLAGGVSYGKRRALEIATTLALDPDVLLLDEPTSGLGAEDVTRITALIASLKGKKTVLMVEHNLSVVSSISDTITVLARGRKIAEGSFAEVSGNPDVMSAYIGSDPQDDSP